MKRDRCASTFECAGCRRQTSVTAGTLAAHRLVLGRLPDGDPLHGLCPAAPETASPQERSTPSATRPAYWNDEASLPFRPKTILPPEQGRSHDGKISSAPSTCGWPKSPPTAPPTSDTSSKLPTPSLVRRCGLATMSMSSGRPPRPAVDPPSARRLHGLRRKHLQAYLDEFVFRFNRRKTRHAAFRWRSSCLATNAEPLTYSSNRSHVHKRK